MTVEVGDKINTSLGIHTLVVAVEKDYLVLQEQKHYVIVHSPYFDDVNDIFRWDKAEYLDSFNELTNQVVVNKSIDNCQELELILRKVKSGNHESYVKSILAIELNITDYKFLNQLYEYYMDNDIQFLNEKISKEFEVEYLKNIKDYCEALDKYSESFDHYETTDQDSPSREDVIEHMAESIFNGNSDRVIIAIDTTIKSYGDNDEIVKQLKRFRTDLENSDFHKYTKMKNDNDLSKKYE